jgi:hypothetical protein
MALTGCIVEDADEREGEDVGLGRRGHLAAAGPRHAPVDDEHVHPLDAAERLRVRPRSVIAQ